MAKSKSFSGGFLALPKAMITGPKYLALSYSAVKLLIDIASQYNGKNNGDLCAAWKVMQRKGWKSEATLNKAKKELLAEGFIALTRVGRLPNLCSLYGITWKALNPNSKLDFGPNGFPAGAWAELPTVKVKKNTTTTTETVVARPHIASETVVDVVA